MGLLGVIGLVAGIAIGVAIAAHFICKDSQGPVTVVAQSTVTLGSVLLIYPDVPVIIGVEYGDFIIGWLITSIATAFVNAYVGAITNEYQKDKRSSYSYHAKF